jgi:hypothetical protein
MSYHLEYGIFSNLVYRSNITTYNDEDFNKVVSAAARGKTKLLAVISSGISINVQNKVNGIDII